MADVPAPVTIRLLGAAHVAIAGTPLALHHQKARALLFYLAATGHAHTRDHLAALLWSDTLEKNARHSLRSTLYQLRQALQARGAEAALIGDGELISLQLDEAACDVAHFRRLIADGAEGALDEAITLYHGGFLQGFTLDDAPLFEEWTCFEQAELRQAYLDALQRLAASAEARQTWDAAIGYLQRLVQLEPLAEEVQQRLIACYLRVRAVGPALRQYRQFETELRQELGLAPSLETQALIREALTPRQRAPMLAHQPTRFSGNRPPALPLVGRDALLKQVLTLGQDVAAGRGMAVLIQGEAGSGKSRLLDEVIARLSEREPHWLILQGSCSPFDDLLSYGPFLEAFQSAELGDLTDLLADAGAPAPDDQERFFWRLVQALRVLARDGPLLLAIDDLHWANSSTLHLFSLLATRLRGLPVLLIGTVQHIEAIPALQRLALAKGHQGDLHLLSLPPLPLEAVTALLHASGIGPTSAAAIAEWLHMRSGGSPFILLELLAQLRAEAILTAVGDSWQLDMSRWLRWRATSALPDTIHGLLAWRFANLVDEARHALEVLAVADVPLPFELVREFLDVPPDHLLALLDDLLARQLVVETSSEMFALPHHLLRETIAARLSPPRRRRIHRRLAEMLEACPALQQHFPLRQTALHAVLGEDVERARRYGLRVLTELPREYDGPEALDFLRHLHDLLAPTATAEEMLRLSATLGLLHQGLGQLDLAAHWHQQRLEWARTVADLAAQASAQFEMAELALVTTDYQAAIAAAEAGLLACAELQEDAQAGLVERGHRLLGAALAMEGSDLPAAESHLRQAVTAHRRATSSEELYATLFELGNVAAQRGELARALDLYAEAAQHAAASRAHYFQALAHNNIAYHSLLLGRPDDARRALAQGLKLAEAHELLGALLHLFSTEGEIHLYLGEWAAAAECFQRGLLLAEDLGHLERQAGYRAGLALAARGQRDLEHATTLLEEALALISDKGYWHLRARLLLWLAEILLQRDRIAEAEPHLEAALQTCRAQGRILLCMQAERLWARVLVARAAWTEANALFAGLMERAESLDLPLERARTQAAWGEALLRAGVSAQEGRVLLAEAGKTLEAHHASAELAALSVSQTTSAQ
ncbi:MAG TPA: AAA family ATPase [Ktedonobacterales bacterium]|nr:AAA family ATPase [Ktedonobacterales bacterium]